MYDGSIRPPKMKMLICLDYGAGWFLRVNTSNRFRPAVAIDVARNPWLDHDSHVECTVLEFDEYTIDDALRSRGPIGRLHGDHFAAILKELLHLPYIRQPDKERLALLLG